MSMAFKGDGLSTSKVMLVLWWMVKQQEPMAPKGTPLANQVPYLPWVRRKSGQLAIDVNLYMVVSRTLKKQQNEQAYHSIIHIVIILSLYYHVFQTCFNKQFQIICFFVVSLCCKNQLLNNLTYGSKVSLRPTPSTSKRFFRRSLRTQAFFMSFQHLG